MVGVEDEYSQELAGAGIDDADVAVDGQQEHVCASVRAADADVLQAPVVAQGD